MSTNSDWTLAAMPDLTGRTAVVTGANSGLGFEVAKGLALGNAEVVLACRSVTKGEQAAADIRQEMPDAKLAVRELDLADLSSVESFADTIYEEYDRLDVLCNNAGVMAIPRQETEDGFEMQLGVNHLGHFALTGHLLDLLIDTPAESRIVTQSSGMHERGEMDFEDLHSEREYDKWEAYGQSKLANLLFAFELDRRLEAAGVEDVTSLGCHPGYADTDLQRRGPEMTGSTLRLYAMKVANALLAQESEQGALPMLYAATAEGLHGGEYIGPDGFMNMRGYPTRDTPSKRARDTDAADRLWERSEEETGVTYDLLADAAAIE